MYLLLNNELVEQVLTGKLQARTISVGTCGGKFNGEAQGTVGRFISISASKTGRPIDLRQVLV